MALIHLRNDSIWHVSRWALRELLALVAAEMPDDTEASSLLHQSEALGALFLDTCEPQLAERIEKVLLRVAHSVADGQAPANLSDVLRDKASWEMFVGGVRDLLRMMVVPFKGGAGAP